MNIDEKKTYYLGKFDTGEIYTEFLDEIAIRQINVINGKYFLSSSLEDWNEEFGYLLYDGKKSDLDLSESVSINEENFEKIWFKHISNADVESFIKYEIGDASAPKHSSSLIIHIVNNRGKWGKGFVLALSGKFPDVKTQYLKWSSQKDFNLGEVQFINADKNNGIYVANMLAQDGIRKDYNDKTIYVSYEKLDECLIKVADFALKNRLTIQMPKIGQGLGGGDWSVILQIIKKRLAYKRIHCKIFTIN
ncbi:macro domain-containing protein [Xylocopilactobacillus apis]|nr:macro domain-containing protein [Xylocopilactobacillus apis]